MRRLVLMCKYLRSHNNDQTKREPHTQIPGAPGAIGAKNRHWIQHCWQDLAGLV
jgi:hypothetical protein